MHPVTLVDCGKTNSDLSDGKMPARTPVCSWSRLHSALKSHASESAEKSLGISTSRYSILLKSESLRRNTVGHRSCAIRLSG